MNSFAKIIMALAALMTLFSKSHAGVIPYAVAPYASSYTAHSVNHALAAPVAAPLVAAPAAAPLVAAPAAAPLVAAPAATPFVAAPAAFPSVYPGVYPYASYYTAF